MSPSRARRLSRFSVIEWFSFAGAVIIGALLIGLELGSISTQIALVIGIPQLLFLIYGAYASSRARNAQKREDSNEIKDANNLAEQCILTHKTLIRTLEDHPEDYRAYMALNQLASWIKLFVSRYRRYLGEKAVRAVLEAEITIMRAGLSRSQDLKTRIRRLDKRIMAIKEDILDVDDPILRDKRAGA